MRVLHHRAALSRGIAPRALHPTPPLTPQPHPVAAAELSGGEDSEGDGEGEKEEDVVAAFKPLLEEWRKEFGGASAAHRTVVCA